MTHLRPLALLFDYLTLLARYDLAYEVRDRARFLAGLIQSGGIGKLKREDGGAAEARGQDGSRMMLEEENFRKGVMVEDLAGENGQQNGNEGDEGDDASEKQSLTSEQVRAVLFEGKAFDATTGKLDSMFPPCDHFIDRLTRLLAPFFFLLLADRSSTSEDAQLGTFALSLPGKRPFPAEPDSLSVLSAYPTSVPPSSIRDPPPGTSPSPAGGGSRSSSRSSTPMQAFGSDSFASSASSGRMRRGGGGGGKVVLVPGSGSGSGSGNGSGTPPVSHQTAAMAAKRGKQSLNDFLAAETTEEEEDDEDTSSEEEEEEDSSDEEEEEEEDGDSSEEAEGTDSGGEEEEDGSSGEEVESR